jgi:hypothetical protein
VSGGSLESDRLERSMTIKLKSLREVLLDGIRRSKQGSYQRRAPCKESIPFLVKARVGLEEFVKAHPDNAEAWRLLSQAEECLLSYRQAVNSLERAMSLEGSRKKGDLKKLALLRESLGNWERFPLSGEELRALGDFLVLCGANEESKGRTIENTRRWLEDNSIDNVDDILEALRARGAATDFQVLYNVVRG